MRRTASFLALSLLPLVCASASAQDGPCLRDDLKDFSSSLPAAGRWREDAAAACEARTERRWKVKIFYFGALKETAHDEIESARQFLGGERNAADPASAILSGAFADWSLLYSPNQKGFSLDGAGKPLEYRYNAYVIHAGSDHRMITARLEKPVSAGALQDEERRALAQIAVRAFARRAK
jgi:hypothetical protein